MSRPVSSAYVADELGVTRSAVSNWVQRGILPDILRPEMVKGPGRDRPQWHEGQLPGLREWADSRRKPPRGQLLEVTASGLLPGDVVKSVRGTRPVRVTVLRRRKRKEEGA